MAKTKTNDNERLYVIPLTDAWKGAYKRRAKKSIAVIKTFASKHMKVIYKNVKIGSILNDLIWADGIKSPPRKVKVRVVKNEENVWVGLQDEKLAFELKAEKDAQEENKKVKEDKSKKEAPKTDGVANTEYSKIAKAKDDTKKADASKPKTEPKPKAKADVKAKEEPKKAVKK